MLGFWIWRNKDRTLPALSVPSMQASSYSTRSCYWARRGEGRSTLWILLHLEPVSEWILFQNGSCFGTEVPGQMCQAVTWVVTDRTDCPLTWRKDHLTEAIPIWMGEHRQKHVTIGSGFEFTVNSMSVWYISDSCFPPFPRLCFRVGERPQRLTNCLVLEMEKWIERLEGAVPWWSGRNRVNT